MVWSRKIVENYNPPKRAKRACESYIFLFASCTVYNFGKKKMMSLSTFKPKEIFK